MSQNFIAGQEKYKAVCIVFCRKFIQPRIKSQDHGLKPSNRPKDQSQVIVAEASRATGCHYSSSPDSNNCRQIQLQT